MDSIKIIRNFEISKEDIEEALALDYESYELDYHLVLDLCLGYFNKNNYIYSMIKHDNQVIGYINVSPINNQAYEKIKKGDIDTFLTKNDIENMKDNSYLNLYFSSIVISKEYRNKGLATKLLLDVIEKYIYLYVERGIKIRRIVADVISDGGKKIVEKLGLNFVTKTQRNTQIFEIIIDDKKPYLDILNSWRKSCGK